MPVFMIERRYAEQSDISAEDIRQLNEINADEDVRWLMSFLSADKRKTYSSTRRSRPRRSCGPPPGPACRPTSSPRSRLAGCRMGRQVAVV